MSTVAPVRVRTLLGGKGFESSLLCLRSLVEYSADPVHLAVHEDGSLTDAQRDQLRAIDPGITFVDRTEADERVGGILARHPRCAAFRRSEIMALKLFDILIYGDPWTAYCDSDFLFLRRYAGLFRVPASGRPTFMTDVGHSYAVRPWQLAPLGSVRLVGRLNAGFTVAPASLLDLDHLEWLFGRIADSSVFARRRYWTEQTCWASLTARSGADLLDPRRVVMATRTMDGYSSEAVAIHFVATHRGRLNEYAAHRRPIDESPVTVATVPASRLGPIRLMVSDIRRRLMG